MESQVLFSSGEAGYFLYRIPALTVSTEGVVLAFCEARRHNGHDDDEIDIVLRKSANNGKTWGPQQVIISDGTRSCGNPCPVVDRDTGTILLTFCKDNQQVFITRSEDEGETWLLPQEITYSVKDPSWTYIGTGPGHGIQLKCGRLLIPSWCDESPGPATWRPAKWGKVQSSVVFFSDDHGKTWQTSEKLTTNASDECEVVEMLDGSVYMNMRSRQGRKCRAFARSSDRGSTWTKVEYDPFLPEPSCQGSIVRLDPTCVLLAHPSKTDCRASLVLRTSTDECQNWSAARVLEPDFAAYSDLAVLRDGTGLCLYEAGSYNFLKLMSFGRSLSECGK
ncbi:MAG: Sialidase [Candidatus Moanabacter tarae]|uniref:exo-alpha-sialidase n=1 Tax=Candidatus Moanibacter tarae TaxID=2200854 RepID=A0A2Z4AF26_9BACT|nr:MAG: Sialidase [Candidatus Moanabacter tarae]